jgi:hypothetical protein
MPFPAASKYLQKRKSYYWSQADITGDTKSGLGSAVSTQMLNSLAETTGKNVSSH